MNKIVDYLEDLGDSRKDCLLVYHEENQHLMKKAKGSAYNHQSWNGGYEDHVLECLKIAHKLFFSLQEIRPLPFTIDSCIIVLYFHDIEKMYQYGANKVLNKKDYFEKELPKKGISFSEQEQNALFYIHGEGSHYSNKQRVMNELAAFCHVVDTISARIWFDCGDKSGQVTKDK